MKNYISSGIRPIFQEGKYCERLKALLDKTIFHDLPFYFSSFQENYLRVVLALIGHLLNSSIPTINITRMSNHWNIGKEKLYELLYVLERIELIKIVRKKGKTAQYTKGAKIFLSDPSLYYCFKGNIGSAREAFLVMCFSERYEVLTTTKEEEGDFVIDGLKVEVGGKKKVKSKADIIFADDLEVPIGKKYPLWVLGLIF